MKKTQSKLDIDLRQTSRKRFFKLLNRATQPLSEEEGQKKESQKHDDYTAKQIRQRKVADASD